MQKRISKTLIVRILLIVLILSTAIFAYVESTEYIGTYAGDKWEHMQSVPGILFAIYFSGIVIIAVIYVFVRMNAQRGCCLSILRATLFADLMIKLELYEAYYDYDSATLVLIVAGAINLLCLILLWDHKDTDAQEKLRRFKNAIIVVITSIVILCLISFLIAPTIIRNGSHEEFSQHMGVDEWVDDDGVLHEEEVPGVIEYYEVSTPLADLMKPLKGACVKMIPLAVIYLILLFVFRHRVIKSVNKTGEQKKERE